jgi:hypothetical protein
MGIRCFLQLNIHRDKQRAAVSGKLGRGKKRIISCESDLRRIVFIDIVCSNAVGKLAFMVLNMWMGVNWQGRENFMFK